MGPKAQSGARGGRNPLTAGCPGMPPGTVAGTAQPRAAAGTPIYLRPELASGVQFQKPFYDSSLHLQLLCVGTKGTMEKLTHGKL